jgi:hypothetical protein
MSLFVYERFLTFCIVLYLLFSSSNPYRRITIPIRYRRSHAQHNKVNTTIAVRLIPCQFVIQSKYNTIRKYQPINAPTCMTDAKIMVKTASK